jgi:DNA-binding transcriptional LysR family regulator
METLARDAPRLRCELVEAETEQSLPALAVGDVDVVLGDEWQHQPLTLASGIERHDLFADPVHLLLPARHPAARRFAAAVPLAELAGEVWAAGYAGMGWAQMVERTCRSFGGFDPDIRHQAADAMVSLALVARGMAVTLLPELILPERLPGIALRRIAEGGLSRTIFAATRATDVERPSTRAVLAAIRAAADVVSGSRSGPARRGSRPGRRRSPAT